MESSFYDFDSLSKSKERLKHRIERISWIIKLMGFYPKSVYCKHWSEDTFL